MTSVRLKLLAPLLCASVFLSACATSPPSVEPPTSNPRFEWFEYTGADPVYQKVQKTDGQYVNPILAGFFPDPSIVRVGEDYYLVNSTFAWFPGIPVHHSRDLVSWTLIGHVLDRPEQFDLDGLEISQGVFAPTIRFHEGTFYVLNTLVGAGGNFLVTATDPAGPWSDPIWLPSVDGIDPDIFFDDDGRAYISNNGPPIGTPKYDGHRALWLQEFDLETMELVGPRRLIVDGGVDISSKPIWIEGPHIFKVDGTYYLIAAEGGTAEGHSQVVFRSDSVWGPWIPYEDNPILTQRHLPDDRPNPVTSTGHADFVQTPSGEWWAVFLGTRPYLDGFYNIGRETFLLPVTWKDGWPTILEDTASVPYVVGRPDLPLSPAPSVPTSGNFTHRDEFDGQQLAPQWNFVRTPRETWHRMENGMLVLDARPVGPGERGQPTLVGRRQQHSHFTASTAMHYRPEQEGDRAGMLAFQNDDFYYFFGVAMDGGEYVIQLETRSGRGPDAVSTLSASIDEPVDGPIYLKIEGRGAQYGFYYGTDGQTWKPLMTDADGTILSTRTAGGFVGTYIALFAQSGS